MSFLFRKKSSVVDDGPKLTQESAPTGALVGEAPQVKDLGKFNPNVNDYAHVKKGISRHTSMTMDLSMVPKENKWSAVTKEKSTTLQEEPEDDMTPLQLVAFKARLYVTYGQLMGDIFYTEYVIKQKKRQFGAKIFDVLNHDGKVGADTLAEFEKYKVEIVALMDKVSFNRDELLAIKLKGECETVPKPRSPRAGGAAPKAGGAATPKIGGATTAKAAP